MPEPSVASELSPTKSSVSWRESCRLGETAPLSVEVYFRLFAYSASQIDRCDTFLWFSSSGDGADVRSQPSYESVSGDQQHVVQKRASRRPLFRCPAPELFSTAFLEADFGTPVRASLRSGSLFERRQLPVPCQDARRPGVRRKGLHSRNQRRDDRSTADPRRPG